MSASNDTTNQKLPEELSGRTLLLIASACGITIANLYYIQPLLSMMAIEFAYSESQMGMMFAICLSGYTLGLLLIVPLGDILESRRLVLKLLVAVALALVAVALSPGLLWLACSMFALGISTVIPQVLVPLSAACSEPHRRGEIVGEVTSGLFLGILLSRTVSGAIAAHYGWRSVYWLALLPTLFLILILVPRLPKKTEIAKISYFELLHSVWATVASQPILQRTCILAALNFAAFTACWTNLAFLTAAPPYNFNASAIGLLGLLGAAGALIAPLAGRFGDAKSPMLTIGLSLLAILASFLLLKAFGKQFWGLIVGIILIDMANRCCQVSTQARVFTLSPELHSRVNTAYMVCFFVGAL